MKQAHLLTFEHEHMALNDKEFKQFYDSHCRKYIFSLTAFVVNDFGGGGGTGQLHSGSGEPITTFTESATTLYWNTRKKRLVH